VSKYHNRQTAAHDGTVFSSARECNRYEELLLLYRMGKIRALNSQVKYELIPKQDGERSCSYIADFTYLDESNCFHCEDTKGCRTKDYVIKRKLMLWVHHIRIEEI
jgi:hypothetical protein